MQKVTQPHPANLHAPPPSPFRRQIRRKFERRYPTETTTDPGHVPRSRYPRTQANSCHNKGLDHRQSQSVHSSGNPGDSQGFPGFDLEGSPVFER
eukprot:695600-Amorphochlora_amoeboformis.AAC.1